MLAGGLGTVSDSALLVEKRVFWRHNAFAGAETCV